MYCILVIAQDRLTRSLLGAQLKEEGFEVIGSATVIEAALQLKDWRISPDLVIIDTLEQDFSQNATDPLSQLCAKVPLLLIHGASDYPSRLRWQAKTHGLAKPVTIGQIVEKVNQLRPNIEEDIRMEKFQ